MTVMCGVRVPRKQLSVTGVRSDGAQDRNCGDERGIAVLNQGHEFEVFGQPKALSFGPYSVLGELGSGGMGVVYRALDTRLHRQVAIKVLHRDLPVSGPRDRFLREARLVSSLSHPNICTVFDIGEQDGDPYLVMELLEGENIKERMERGPVPPEDVREVAFRVGLALQAAHARGIVHRDIKPANLFLLGDGRGSLDIKVLDFGLAKMADGNRSAHGSVDDLTRAGATVGTVEYMSPEQACGEPMDARSDLFSLGAVLYEMATGAVPFRGATSAIVFSELLNRDPVPPRERNLDIPASLDAVIRGLLTKDKALRLGSASAMLDALAAPSCEREAVFLPVRRGAAPPPAPASVGYPVRRSLEAVQPVAEQATSRRRRNPAPVFVGSPAQAVFGQPRVPAKPQDPVAAKAGDAAGHGDGAKGKTGPRVPTMPSVPGVQSVPAGLAVPPPASNVEAVHTGWKVALAAGVIVAVLLTLLVILAMGAAGNHML